MNRNLIGLILLVSGLHLVAQNSDMSVNPTVSDQLILKLDLSQAINPVDPSILLGVEYRPFDSYSFTTELGWIQELRGESNSSIQQGFKIREELRKYIGASGQEKVNGYFGISLFYRNVEVDDEFSYGFGCDGPRFTCDYIKYQNANIQTHRYGGILKLGMLSTQTDRWLIEADIGFGFLYLLRRTSSPLEGGTVYTNDSFYHGDNLGWSAAPTFNARIGYVLSKKRD